MISEQRMRTMPSGGENSFSPDTCGEIDQHQDAGRLRVLFISGIRGMSGAEIVLARFIENNSDLDAAVLLPRGPLYDYLSKGDARLYRSRGLRELDRRNTKMWPLVFIFRWLISSFEVLRVCWKERPDVIHATHFAAAIY